MSNNAAPAGATPTVPGAPGRDNRPGASGRSQLESSHTGFISRLFEGSTRAAGISILVVLAAVAVFLIIQAIPAFTTSNATIKQQASWFTASNFFSYVGPLVWGTILASIIALVIAIPVAIGIALFITHFAPRRIANVLGYLVDLLAAIPSVVYGLWGAIVLLPKVSPVYTWLSKLGEVSIGGFKPLHFLFGGPVATPARVIFSAGLVLALMVLPIITAIAREAFAQTPSAHEEAALALGATRWEMIKMAVLPFGRSGLIGGCMLGLGRALGETMAVVMILSPGLTYSFFLFKAGVQQTIAANIALQFPEAGTGIGRSILIATGLALFIITLVVNMVARRVTSKLGVRE